MSTTALIGLKNQDLITAIYVHYDGGLWKTGVGETILNHYNTVAKIRKLLAMERNRQYKESEKRKEWYRKYNNSEKGRISQRKYRYSTKGTLVVKAIRKRRREQMIVQNDQTITPDYITSIFAKAKSCPYCGKKMSDVSGNTKDVKTLDHLIPIKKGGLHSRHNTIVCCHSCNSRKADKDFLSWLNNLDEPYRSKAEKLYVKKYGALPTQGFLPLVFTTEEDLNRQSND